MFTACGGDNADDTPARVDGTVFPVASPPASEATEAPTPGAATTGTLVPDLSIGVLDGPGEYIFGQVSDVALCPEGSIYVLDGQAGTVRKYDPDGRHVRDIGRLGRGPGEFGRPLFIAVHPDGLLFVADRTAYLWADRLHVFASDGEFLDTWVPDFFIEPPIRFDTAGTIYLRQLGTAPTHASDYLRSGPIDSADSPPVRGIRSLGVRMPRPLCSLSLPARFASIGVGRSSTRSPLRLCPALSRTWSIPTAGRSTSG
ncbi:MAG TPA: hypothetical protein VNZ57_11165 [Longimicrobiales bacterium]|nr:hypothetical protein [Longimicrobiales bacterium]